MVPFEILREKIFGDEPVVANLGTKKKYKVFASDERVAHALKSVMPDSKMRIKDIAELAAVIRHTQQGVVQGLADASTSMTEQVYKQRSVVRKQDVALSLFMRGKVSAAEKNLTSRGGWSAKFCSAPSRLVWVPGQ